MRLAGPILAALAAAALVPAAADAAPTARSIAIGGHPAFVRVTVSFTGGSLAANDPELIDPAPADGLARARIVHAGIRTKAAAASRLGVMAELAQATGRLRLRIATPHRRFKYVARRVLHGPERVVVDLYRSRPPTGAASRPGRASSCLSIGKHADSGGTIAASGGAHGIFENQFTLAVRNAAGRVVGHRTVTFGPTAPRWSSTVSYGVTSDQPGTLEAVELSARDGALACLAQIAVPLVAPLAPPG